ncbi:MAG TPA: hypothetical protein PKK60_02485 [archaeon]|nr:hypothetical protein [archaeon]
MKQIFLGQKGQAALMDSLFFMAIVSAICTTLFFFTANYGVQLDKQVSAFYSSDFASDTLKVVSYINVLRDGSSIYQHSGGPVELDYLLAMMKEDYSDKKEFSCQTRKALVNTFDSSLKPFSDSLDYAFYFVNTNQDSFLFLMMVVHECNKEVYPEECICYKNYSSSACTGNTEGVNSPDFIKLNYYYCKPQSTGILKDKVFPYAGKVDVASSKFDFTDDITKTKSSTFYDAELAMWVSKDIESLNSLSQQGSEFNCVLIDPAVPCP